MVFVDEFVIVYCIRSGDDVLCCFVMIVVVMDV